MEIHQSADKIVYIFCGNVVSKAVFMIGKNQAGKDRAVYSFSEELHKNAM